LVTRARSGNIACTIARPARAGTINENDSVLGGALTGAATQLHGGIERAVTDLVYHLVTDDERRRAAAELHRVLAPQGQAFIAFVPRPSGVAALIDGAAVRPAQVPEAVWRAAANTGVFANPTASGFQEGYYPEPRELVQLLDAAGLRCEDMLSLKSIANDRAHHVARLEPVVRAEVERVARAWCCREEVIALCGHALVVARR
jgi:hypothetical protein